VLRGEAQVFERLIPRPDGSIRIGLAHYVPDIVDGVVRGFCVEVIDAKTLEPAWTKPMSDLARQAVDSRAQDAVARAVSERTRNALNAILGLGYLLRQEAELQPRHARWVDGILESARGIESLLLEIEGPSIRA
jgi:signal transduction histidine kinase